MIIHPWRTRLLASVAVLTAGGVYTYHPRNLSYWPFLLVVAWVLLWLARGVAAERIWRRAHANSTTMVTSEDAHKGNGLLIGHGFRWTSRHTGVMREFLRARGALPEATDARGGTPTLHAIGVMDEAEVRIPSSHLSGHNGIQGATRAGKSELLRLMVDQVISAGDGPVVLIDPKGGAQLCAQAIATATRMKRRVAVLCPALKDLSTPVDPLSTCESAVEVANRVRTLFPANTGQYQFFTTNPVYTVQMVAQMQQATGQPWSLKNLYRDTMISRHRLQLLIAYLGTQGCDVSGWSTGRIPPVNTVIQFVRQSGIDDPMVDEILSLFELPPDKFTETHRNLSLALSGLIDTDYASLFEPSTNALTWETIERENIVVIVLTSSLLTREAGNKVGRLILQDLVGYAAKRYLVRRTAHPPPITVLIDELGEVVYDDFVQAVAKLGEAAVRFVMAWQSESDITRALGRDSGQSLLANIGTRITLRLADQLSAESASKSLGECQVLDITDGTSMTTHGRDDQITNAMRRQSQRQVALVAPEWFRALPKGEGFALLQGAAYKFNAPLLEDLDEAGVRDAGYAELLVLPPDDPVWGEPGDLSEGGDPELGCERPDPGGIRGEPVRVGRGD